MTCSGSEPYPRQLAISQGVHAETQVFLDRAAQVFNTPRFTLLYRRWLKQGNPAFDAVTSPVIAETLASGAGRVECLVLPYTYRHLSPLANLGRSAPTGLERNERGGEHSPSQIPCDARDDSHDG
jgi:hypothetical protein